MTRSEPDKAQSTNHKMNPAMETDDEALLIDCSQCGVPFEPMPDAFMECGLSPVPATDEEVALLMAEGAEFITIEELIHASPEQLTHLGIDDVARARLLRGDCVTTGAMAICPQCVEKIEREGKLLT